MKRSQKFLQALMVLALCASLLAPAALQAAARPTRVQDALAQAVAAAPGEMVRVIVQKTGTTNEAKALVARLGGEVTKDLDFVNAFAAELPGAAVARLGQSASVNWVALDAPMMPATTPGSGPDFTLRDEFTSGSYNGNNGTVNWRTSWIEDDDGSSEGGYIRLSDSDHCYQEDCLKITPTYGLGGPSIYRAANLSGTTSAILSFSFEHNLLKDQIVLEVSTDGGASYTVLKTYTAGVAQPGNASFDLTPYLSDDFRLRFRIGESKGSGSLWIDNFQISATSEADTHFDTLDVDQLHTAGLTGQGVTVAVIDSGIANHADFAGRLVSTYEYGIGDPYGHGTHVAGIIGGDGAASDGKFTGIAPGVNLISLGVTDQYGMAYESDVVAALQWVFDHHQTSDIKVVNISLNSSAEDTYHNSALDAAMEMLSFKGIVVVVSAGNSGINGTYNTAKTAPANDPFVIVVGASDEYDTADRIDDVITDFTAYAVSLDGHMRPDLIAPGYNIYAPLSPESSWDETHPDRLAFGGRYIRLSGTSMSAPIVAGTVALLLEDEPNLTPDQIKYRLQNTGSTLYTGGNVTPGFGGGYAYLDAHAAIYGTSTAEANQGLMPHQIIAKMAMIAYWASQNGGATIDWGSVNWDSVNWDSVNWDSVNWDSVNWDSVNWDSVNWDSVNWDSVNWDSVNWDSVNWDSVNWDSVNWDSVNWDSVNWDSGTGSTTMNGLIAKFGPEDATRAVKQVRSDGLFWGEYERNPTPAADCVPATEKGNTPLTVCPVETVLEK